jgi:hypothetical protein
MADYKVFPIETLRNMLRYDPETGNLFWRPRTPDQFRGRNEKYRAGKAEVFNKIYAGKAAGNIDRSGYAVVRVLYKGLLVHRAVWAMHHGRWPEGMIDHINGIKTDNRIANLREATPTTNSRNARMQRNNKR